MKADSFLMNHPVKGQNDFWDGRVKCVDNVFPVSRLSKTRDYEKISVKAEIHKFWNILETCGFRINSKLEISGILQQKFKEKLKPDMVHYDIKTHLAQTESAHYLTLLF